MRRAQRPAPLWALDLLAEIPEGFISDGCTNAPDTIFGFDLSDGCVIHDWRYCTRCHPPGALTQAWRIMSDVEMRDYFRAVLPTRWRWVRWIYHAFVNVVGGFRAFDSCGPEAGLICRHGMRLA